MTKIITRPLTEGEITLAKMVFRDSVDYSKVTISNRCLSKTAAVAPNGHIFMGRHYCGDFSKLGADGRAFFIHEMTHVWQHQNKVLHPVAAAAEVMLRHKFNYDAAYNYTLDDNKPFTSYNLEQQAMIVQDYYSTRFENCAPSRRCKNSCDLLEKLRLYNAILKDFLQDPSYARRKSFFSPGGGRSIK